MTTAAVLLAKNIVPFLVVTCKAYSVFMVLPLCTTLVVKVFFLPVEPWETRTCTPDLTYQRYILNLPYNSGTKTKKIKYGY